MNIHVRGMLMQRMGNNETRSSMYVNVREDEKHDASTQIAKEGIKLELCCARTNVLEGLLYDIAWNHAREVKLSDDDIKLCIYACLMSWFKKIQLYANRTELFSKKIKN